MNGRAGHTLAHVVVIERAGRNYSAYAPDLPGVITTGPTPRATERNLRDAIAFHSNELRAAGEPTPVSTTRATDITAPLTLGA